MKIYQKSDGETTEIKKDTDNIIAAKIEVLAQKAKSHSLRCKMEMDNPFTIEESFEKKDDIKRHIFSLKSGGNC